MKYALIFAFIFFLIYSLVLCCKGNKPLFVDCPISRDFSIVAKGLAISIIVYGHLGNYFNTRYLTPLGGIGVAVFLILSGYGLNQSWNGNGKDYFWAKRLIGFFVPYFIIETATIPLRESYSSVFDALLDLSGMRSSYYLGWYISFLLLWYAAFYFAKRYIKHRHTRYFLWTTIGAIIFIVCSMLRARQAFSFGFGVWLSDHEEIQRAVKDKPMRYLVFSGIIGIVLLGIKQTVLLRTAPYIAQKMLDLVMSLSFAVCLLVIILVISRVNQKTIVPLYYLGVISYELYLIHGYTMLVVDLTIINAVEFYALTLFSAVVAHVIISRIRIFLQRVMFQEYKPRKLQ